MKYVTKHALAKLAHILKPSPAFRPHAQHLHSKLQNVYKFDTIDDVVALFHHTVDMQHPSPSVVEFIKILQTIVKMKDYATAISLCTHVESKGILPCSATLNLLMNCYCHLGQVRSASSVMGKIFKSGYEPSIVSWTALMKEVCKTSGAGHAVQMLQKMEAQLVKPNLVIYNLVLDCLCKDGFLTEALILLYEVIIPRMTPDVCTFNIILNGLCKKGLPLETQYVAVCGVYIKTCVQPDVITYNVLMNSYCLHSKVDKARKLFHRMIQRSLVPDAWSYNILVKGYCQD